MTEEQSLVENKPSFEQCLERLHTVVELLEHDNLSLDESLQLFAEGVQLVRSCQEQLEQAEMQVELLQPGLGEKISRRPFRLTEEE
jgi:exodeoxyribonuclease VII small subunit